MTEEELEKLYDSLNLAMTFRDFLHIQKYFSQEEKRDPSVTEIRVLDTYWSDHCRHTTFSTELKDVEFEEGDQKAPIEGTYRQYLSDPERSSQEERKVRSHQVGPLRMWGESLEGRKLQDQEESDEINACSIVVPVEIDGKEEEWLVTLKTRRTTIPPRLSPFGGAATCLGGAIRDPLSGRTYVYQAMRVTVGSADPTVSVKVYIKRRTAPEENW